MMMMTIAKMMLRLLLLIIMMMMMMMIVVTIALKGVFRDFYTLLTAPRTVPNTYAQVGIQWLSC